MSVVVQRPTPPPSSHRPPALLSERQFLHALRLERSRAERSQAAFLLALIDMPAGRAQTGRAEVLLTVAHAVTSVLRDTDVAGWYSDGTTVGVIFTLLNQETKATAKAAIHSKLTSAISKGLPAQRAKELRVSYHFFPESDGGAAEHPALYPDSGARHVSRGACIVKRCMDVAGSLLFLLLFSPLFATIALLIKLTSPGPVLFRQIRIGQYGKPFTFLKFRSMHLNSDASIHREYVTQLIAGKKAAVPGAQQGVFKIVDDPRVTRLGRWLRRSSLDELPQFINVLKGDMALIGPRPPVPYEFEKYAVWHRRRVMEVRPGITGLWQVSGRSRTTFDEMVRLDLQYARTWSIWLDLKILVRTPGAVLSGAGAY